ncbi:phenylacetate--CoA ligase family protein [Arenibacter certesii]|uniref:Capsular polysaccharide biosynthesis protein n=1 Tax=Arenibacter certesii TaxID=228955 RepID=A0A918J2W4_9FLAO|nr:phenylacetate--CoA ligase family protein [Arenibacter certesii]GGW44475.1 capsular polysaccharide biosynthesis protein [Arenibacter certesii]
MIPSIRYIIFWLVDYLKGAKVRKHYNSLKRINEDHGSASSVSEREQYLSEMLNHCIKTVPFYRNLGIADVNIDQFPITNKNLIKKNPDAFLSESYKDKKKYYASTSGSTGIPFTIIHNSDKKLRRTAEVHFFGDLAGHTLGTGFIYIKIWNENNRKGKLTQKKENIIPIDVFKLDDQKIEKLLKRIKASNNPKSILAYASALDSIVKYLDRNPTDMIHAGVTSVIAMSETLEEYTKSALKKYFNCPVVSRYANIENGIIAQQTSEFQNEFLINLGSYHIEVLDLHEDTPAKNGESGRIVITDLFNKSMPLIRYDTGDLGALGKKEENGRTYYIFEKIEGRKMDIIYNTRGEVLSSYFVSASMWKYTELRQYQFIQNGKKEYEIKLNLEGHFQREKEMLQDLKTFLGDDAEVMVTYVEEIPLLASGKRKKVTSNLKK